MLERKRTFLEKMNWPRLHATGLPGSSRLFPTLEENTWNWELHFLLQPRTPQLRASFESLRRPNVWAITQFGPMSAYCIPSQASHNLMGQPGSFLSPISQPMSQLKHLAMLQPAHNVSSWVQASSMPHSSRRFCLPGASPHLIA